MAEAQEFPEIEPGTFDVIVIGTGLQESIMAAAAASLGQSVLHIDSNSFYGHHWASLSLDELTQWASSGGRFSATQLHPQINNATAMLKSPDGEELLLEAPTDRIVYSDFEQKSYSSEGLGPSRSFNLDIAGPKLCLCRGLLVDLLLKSGASKYMEFKSVESSYIWSGFEKGLMPVPDSRASIFQDRTLSLAEKKHLMKFFKLIQNQEKLTQEDLESSFVHFLDRQCLPSSIKSMILYAIALADYDQEDESQGQSTVLRTKDGIERLVLYLSSIGRFVNASGAFLYPVYGQAELPQAFCRTAAIKGTIYVLRMAVTGLLIGKESGIYKGIKIASGQHLFSHKLVINFSTALPSGLSSSLAELKLKETESGDIKLPATLDASMELIKIDTGRIEQMLHPIIQSPSKVSWKVARCICITNQSLKPDLSTVLVAFPPRSIFGKQRTTIRCWKLQRKEEELNRSTGTVATNHFHLRLERNNLLHCVSAAERKKADWCAMATILFSRLWKIITVAVAMAGLVIQIRACRTFCGNTSVDYPFGIDEGCGHRHYRELMYCINNVMMLHLPSGSYQVLSIDYAFRLLTLSDPYMSTCSSMHKSLGFVVHQRLSPYLRPTPDNAFMLLGCSNNSRLFQGFPDTHLPCSNSSASGSAIGCDAFYDCPAWVGMGQKTKHNKPPPCCSIPYASVGALNLTHLDCYSYASAYSSAPLRYKSAGDWSYGLQLSFDVPGNSSFCASCKASRGVCGFGVDDDDDDNDDDDDWRELCLCGGWNSSTTCDTGSNSASAMHYHLSKLLALLLAGMLVISAI